MKYLVSEDQGCMFKLNDGVLESAPFMHDPKDGRNYIVFTDEFSPVEPDLVGEEVVTFRGEDATLYEVFEWVENKLGGVK